jgi:hypothetical protein
MVTPEIDGVVWETDLWQGQDGCCFAAAGFDVIAASRRRRWRRHHDS